MPSRNIVKQYVEGGIYHAYNRGVAKRDIFIDDLDYQVFTKYLGLLLSPPKLLEPASRLKNYWGSIQLICYCLMPNHFHLQLRQTNQTDMADFMRSLSTAYSMYFNKRYQRVGGLFQDAYKACLIDTEEYMMHCSRYIHLNPHAIGESFEGYRYSSYAAFTQTPPPIWLNPQPVMELFRDKKEYGDFVTDYALDSTAILGDLSFDHEPVRPLQGVTLQ